MSFLYPLGLLGLIGIPILVIIYIIKSKYTEQTVSSTYLWTLSERFLKRKNPISKVTGIISLILQLLAITIISLAIAHPVFTLPGVAKEYCFVLDASGSMNIVEQGASRFELGKAEIKEIVEDSAGGSRYSLIYVGSNTRVVYKDIEDKEQALLLLNELKPSYTEIDYQSALGEAQRYFNENDSTVTYLITDTNYANHQNVNVINVATAVTNYAIQNATYVQDGDRLQVNGYVIGYEGSKPLELKLYVDNFDTPLQSTTAIANNYTPTPFQFIVDGRRNFEQIKIVIADEDTLKEDNEVILYNLKSELTYKTVLISDHPFYLESIIKSVSSARLDVISVEEYSSSITGYGLYIFDGFVPEAAPKDGSVWLINPTSNLEGSGFTVQNVVPLEEAGILELTTSSSSQVQKLKQGLKDNDVYIKEYVKCSPYRNFTTLYSYKGNPIIFAGTNTGGNREVVFAFDFSKSNFPVLYGYIPVIKNLLDYSFPEFLEATSYTAGDKIAFNVVANCDFIKVQTPSGDVTYLDTDDAVAEYSIEEVGSYTVTLSVAKTHREYKLYSSLPENERTTYSAQTSFSLQGVQQNDGYDGRYDDLLIFFIVLSLVFVADWMVYCYEKYQLR